MITFTSCFVMGKDHEDIPKIRGLGFSDLEIVNPMHIVCSVYIRYYKLNIIINI